MIESLVGTLVGPIADLLGKAIPDKDQRAKLAHEIATLSARQAHTETMGQIEIAKEQAKHSSLFVAGARPAILWICAAALLFNTIIHPSLLIWHPELAPVNGDLLYPVMLTMLGMGAARSWEKAQGVARSSL